MTMLQLPMAERTLGGLLHTQARRRGDRTFLLFEGKSYSYREAAEAASSLAAGLQRCGVRKGDHVSVLMHNCPEMLWTLFALGMLGAVTVPLNTASKGDLLTYFIDQSDSSTVIADAELVPNLLAATAGIARPLRYIVRTEEGLALPATTPRAAITLASLFGGPAANLADSGADFREVQWILYTSGTTGRSKGVMCTHAQEQTGGLYMAQQMAYTEDDVLYTCLPLFHANALRVTVNAALWAGAAVALSRRFSASNFWSEIRTTGATQFNALGAMANIILRQPPAPGDRDHRVRLCNIVPALPQEVAEEFEQRFGLVVTSMYGSTEMCCPIFAPPDTPRSKGPTCGRVVPPFEVRVVDENDFEVPHGEAGEWVVRATDPWYVFDGYYGMPAESAAALRNFWFHSGDRGHRDEDGYFYFIDRNKDCVRRRGENISSYEVEMSISQHPSVLEVAVVPHPSEMSEDEVLAFVVLKEGRSCTQQELIDFCEGRMAKFMVPRFLRFLPALPRTPSEKIEKYKLRQLAAAEPQSLWDRTAPGAA